MDNVSDFEEDFKLKFGHSVDDDFFDIVEAVMIGEDTPSSDYWDISSTEDKIHALQSDFYITAEGQNGESVFLEYENGINNGTQLNGWDFNPDAKPPTTKIIEIVDDIILDEPRVKGWFRGKRPDASQAIMNQMLAKARIIFAYNKSDIQENMKKKSYDNYVTGGGTLATDRHYKRLDEKLNNKGIFWEPVYKTIEVQI